MQITIES